MATLATGVTVTWNAVPFSEVYALSVNTGGARQGRSSAWPQHQGGSVTVGAFGSANMATSSIGERKALSISGGGVTLTGYAILESVAAEPELNGVTRFTASLTLCD